MSILYPGRMISGSKSGYMSRYPTHDVVFNANLCTRSAGKVWFGDLDLTVDESNLLELRKELEQDGRVKPGEDIFVLREMDARFENETKPKFDSAVAIVTETGVNFKKDM